MISSDKKVWLFNIPRIPDELTAGIKEVKNIFLKTNIPTAFVEINHQIYKNFFDSTHWPQIENFGLMGGGKIPLLKIYRLMLKEIKSHKIKPNDTILISVFTIQSRSWAILICYILKKYFKNKIWVGIGGQGCRVPGESKLQSEFADTMLEHNFCDTVFLGDVDKTLPKFIADGMKTRGKLYQQNQSFPLLGFHDASLVTDHVQRVKNNSGYENLQIQNEVADFSEDKKKFGDKFHIQNIYFTRGCIKKCTFCDVHRIWPRFTMKPAEEVIAEIDHYHKIKPLTHIDFFDDTINSSNSEFLKFLHLLYDWMQRNKCFDLKWSSPFAIKPTSQQSEEMFELLHKTNADLRIGFDHCDDDVLSHMGKKYTLMDIYHFLASAKKFNFDIKRGLWIIGYPTETDGVFEQYAEKLDALLQKFPDAIYTHDLKICSIPKHSSLEKLLTISHDDPENWFNHCSNITTRKIRKQILGDIFQKNKQDYW